MKYRARTQNPHNSGASEPEVGSVDIVYGFLGAEILLSDLRARGVELSIDPSGGLAFNAPKGVMTYAIVERIRAQREDLVALLERSEKRASIMEHYSGMNRGSSDRNAWSDMVDHAPERVDDPEEMPAGVSCPWCRGRRLIDGPLGLRCWDCDRMAWVYVLGAIVRLDHAQSGLDNFHLTNECRSIG